MPRRPRHCPVRLAFHRWHRPWCRGIGWCWHSTMTCPGAPKLFMPCSIAWSSAGCDPADIHLLTSGAARNARSLLPADYRDRATVSTHDPEARDSLSYLAVAADDEPIYLNRLLCDADVVVPIGGLRCEPAIDYHGMFGGLFPTFAGRQSQDKLFASGVVRTARDEARCREKIQEVGWLLGVQFTVQVVPGPGGEVLQVLAGMPGDVFREGQSACQQAWACSVPRMAQLVIAAIDGPSSEQTWDNVARALAAAQRVVSAGGTIALCTSLDEPPGPNVRQAAELKDLRQALRVFSKRRRERFASRGRACAGALRIARVPDERTRRVDGRRTRRHARRQPCRACAARRPARLVRVDLPRAIRRGDCGRRMRIISRRSRPAWHKEQST